MITVSDISYFLTPTLCLLVTVQTFETNKQTNKQINKSKEHINVLSTGYLVEISRELKSRCFYMIIIVTLIYTN